MKKVVLITGCSSGFGFGLALQFARSGYYTYASVRDLKSKGAKELLLIKGKQKLPLEVIEIDVTNEKMIKKAVEAVVTKSSRIDILINNAGYGYLGPIEGTPLADIEEIYKTNVFGTIRMVQAVVPIMRKKKSGRIINMSSINGIVPFPLFSIYSSTKYAIETLTEGLRFELKHFGIAVTAIEPGSYLTSFTSNRKQPSTLMDIHSPYKQLITNFFSRYRKTHDIQQRKIASKTADPSEVINAVFRIAEVRDPKPRYRIGRDAHKNYYIRKVLPFFLWERVLSMMYRW